MRKRWRRLWALILAVCFVGVSVPIGVWVAERRSEMAAVDWSPLYVARVQERLAPQLPTEAAAAIAQGSTGLTVTCDLTCFGTCPPNPGCFVPTIFGPTCGDSCPSPGCLPQFEPAPTSGGESTCAGSNCPSPSHGSSGQFDFGNAARPYPTLLSQDGARHRMGTRLWLGCTVRQEADGQPGMVPVDNPGVWFSSSLVPGAPLTVVVDVSAPDETRGGYLDGWIDFSGRHTWLAAEDQVFASRKLGLGLNVLTATVPSTAVVGDAYSRFRFGSQGGLKPTGEAQDGEVEDHAVAVCSQLRATIQMDKLAYRVGERQTVIYSVSEESDVILTDRTCDGTASPLGSATLPAGTYQFAGSLLPLTAKLPEGTQWIEMEVKGRASGCETTVAAPFKVVW